MSEPSKALGDAQPPRAPAHISDNVREALAKQNPEIRSGVLRVADQPRGK